MSKLFTISLLASSLALATPAAHAQVKVSIGPVAGETLMKQRFSNGGTVDYRFGFVAGGQAYLSWGRFALQPALLFAQKGYKYSTQVDYRPDPNSPPATVELTGKQRLNYLTLPVNLVFAPSGTATGPQFFAGPYMSMLLGGSVEQGALPGQPASSTSIRIANEIEPREGPAARRFETGLQAGVGFRYEAFVLQATYSLGLSNTRAYYTLNPGGTSVSNSNAYNQGFQVSVAYLVDVIR
jgi:hypothetical protein